MQLPFRWQKRIRFSRETEGATKNLSVLGLADPEGVSRAP